MKKRILKSLQDRPARALTKKAFVGHTKLAEALYIPQRHIVATCMPVRGFTASHSHRDTHCCVGSFLQHDYAMLYREDGEQRFVIVDIELQISSPLHHFFVLPTNLPAKLFERIITLHSHHRHVPSSVANGYNATFTQRYTPFARPEHFMITNELLVGKIAECMQSVRQTCIYEVYDKHLYVYSYGKMPPLTSALDAQVSLAAVIAGFIEDKNNKKSA